MFKNITLYTITGVSFDYLRAGLQERPLAPCTAAERVSRGWVPFYDRGFTHSQGSKLAFCLGVAERLLPASVVNQEALIRAAQIEKDQGYRVGRKQMRELRDQVTDELLPKAFTRLRTTRAWIDTASGYLFIDTPSPAKAEEFVEQLSKVDPDLVLAPWTTRIPIAQAMNEWLTEAPRGFSVDRDLELHSFDNSKTVIKYANHSLDGDDVPKHLAEGKYPTKMGLTWADNLSFILTDDRQLKRLSLCNVEQTEADNADDQFDADFELVTGTVSMAVRDLDWLLT